MSDIEKTADDSHQPQLRISDPVERDIKKCIPLDIWVRFSACLRQILLGRSPSLPCEKLKAAGPGIFELKINGRPAYRCMFKMDDDGSVIVLHVAVKTAQGVDRNLIRTTKKRSKDLPTASKANKGKKPT